MKDAMTMINNMVWNLTHRLGIVDVVDILIMAVIVYELLILVRRTRSSALLKGVFLMVVIVIASSLLGLTSLNWLMSTVLNNGAVVLLILFQPEIRKALERMGRSTFLNKSHRGCNHDQHQRGGRGGSNKCRRLRNLKNGEEKREKVGRGRQIV